jgi:hypothetical protein
MWKPRVQHIPCVHYIFFIFFPDKGCPPSSAASSPLTRGERRDGEASAADRAFKRPHTKADGAATPTKKVISKELKRLFDTETRSERRERLERLKERTMGGVTAPESDTESIVPSSQALVASTPRAVPNCQVDARF